MVPMITTSKTGGYIISESKVSVTENSSSCEREKTIMKTQMINVEQLTARHHLPRVRAPLVLQSSSIL